MGGVRGLGRGGRILLAFVVAGAVFGIATAVQASIPDASGVIHGCYAKSAAPGSQPGGLRVIDTALGQACQPSEGALTWGQKGSTGSRGPTGPPGPSDAYTVYGAAFVAATGGSEPTIVSISLPAGAYTLSGTIDGHLKAAPPGPSEVAAGFCAYSTSGGTATLHQESSDWWLSSYDAGDSFKTTIPLLGDVTISSGPATVNIYCDNVDAGSETADFIGAIHAARVGALH